MKESSVDNLWDTLDMISGFFQGQLGPVPNGKQFMDQNINPKYRGKFDPPMPGARPSPNSVNTQDQMPNSWNRQLMNPDREIQSDTSFPHDSEDWNWPTMSMTPLKPIEGK